MAEEKARKKPRKKKTTRQPDVNQIAARIVSEATGTKRR